MTKWIYSFGDGNADGNASMRNLLGGKGANLAEMCSLGLPVPSGFTITTEVCTSYYDNNRNYPSELKSQIKEALENIEKSLSVNFGDESNPLLVSVRSGGRASMPGMMDTVLNLGLNDKTVLGIAKKSNNERFAYDSYRRFIQMYSDVVLGVDHYHFEEILDNKKIERNVIQDTELDGNDLKDIVDQYKAKVQEALGKPFPQDVNVQLFGAIGAVFDSWMNDRAITYRRLHDIPQSWGTAVNIQSMVFGNMGEDCATGVAFTRDPSTGDNEFYGEFLINAQGEDVVAGIRTPQQITIKGKEKHKIDLPSMEECMNGVYNDLVDIYQKLESHYKDMQDIEFTVQGGKLWILQTRNGKRTAPAAIKIAVDMVKQGIISKEEAISRIAPDSLDQLLHPTLDPNAHRRVLERGLPASPGAASGIVVFSAEDAEVKANAGHKVILVRTETSPEDIHGMHISEAILTARGGMTSHAAVVARGMGKPCVSGAGGMRIDYENQSFTTGGVEVKAGEMLTIDGSSGEVIYGEVPTIEPKLSDDFGQIMKWSDEIRHLKVRTNAETPEDAKIARKFGAEGIGLCRTEHMFFQAERIVAVREMILADNKKDRCKALEKIRPMQRDDFSEIFKVMDGFPVTLRLLDPPLHEFLPHTQEDMQEVANVTGIDIADIRRRANQLHEHNPMLGHRGCRLGITYPEIYEMQAKAIFQAAIDAQGAGCKVLPEIMIPLILGKEELDILKKVVIDAAEQVFAETGKKVDYMVGTMIELPRAALQSGEIAKTAEFFSFGTNDLTQTTLGISRDDSSSFINDYKEQDIFEYDPFVRLDRNGPGELIKIASKNARKTNPNIKLGICGEHGGDPDSINFCQELGLNYVSCSPFRVPIARLAAAQAVLDLKDSLKEAA